MLNQLLKAKEDNERLRFHLAISSSVILLLSVTIHLIKPLAIHDLITAALTFSVGICCFLWLRACRYSVDAVKAGFYASILQIAFLIRCAPVVVSYDSELVFMLMSSGAFLAYLLTTCWWLSKVYHK
ncbi:TPA: hypothetical protein I7730_15810 [Vibrio vulnificus]|uniref:Uncharacterized protein n=1 Tax=Vibrio vulnificus TaxID=672 RepID=A0A8H9N1U6_VIBVL|nr:hypothetical protein [Vibrio vulnificus]